MEIYTDRACLINPTPGDPLSPSISLCLHSYPGRANLYPGFAPRHGNSWVGPGTSSFKAKAGWELVALLQCVLSGVPSFVGSLPSFLTSFSKPHCCAKSAVLVTLLIAVVKILDKKQPKEGNTLWLLWGCCPSWCGRQGWNSMSHLVTPGHQMLAPSLLSMVFLFLFDPGSHPAFLS